MRQISGSPRRVNTWSPPPAALRFVSDEVHLWRAFLDVEPAFRSAEAELSADELTRASRFAFLRDRRRFTAGRRILREILGKYLRQMPSEIRFTYEVHGKPRLSLRPYDPPIRFNVSHSEGLAVYAIAANREIGVDVEAIRADVPMKEIAAQFFSGREISEFRSIPKDKQAEAFFLGWTRKEAYLKALGTGLSVPLRAFDVSLNPETPAHLRSHDSERWTITDFQPEKGYVGTVVVEGEDHALHLWNYSLGTNTRSIESTS